jgi:hypothetical protein
MLRPACFALLCFALLCFAFFPFFSCRYDLPSDYSILMLQYRYWGQDCVSRWFELPDNRTELASSE